MYQRGLDYDYNVAIRLAVKQFLVLLYKDSNISGHANFDESRNEFVRDEQLRSNLLHNPTSLITVFSIWFCMKHHGEERLIRFWASPCLENQKR